ncbi:Oligoendopeptidase F-like protein [Neochlamydia sp. TUME1]|nr:Oligoendopeptidase F-like protein [Neochlamydia sp. TUME1]
MLYIQFVNMYIQAFHYKRYNMLKKRSQVAKKDCWNVESLYHSLADWQKDFISVAEMDKSPHWPQLARFRGKLGKDAKTLEKALEVLFDISRKLSKLYTYAHLRHDEDITNDEYKAALAKITHLHHAFNQESAWFEPELLALPGAELKKLRAAEILKSYRFYLEKIVRLKKYTLSAEKEELVALSGEAMSTGVKAFSAINDADFKFEKVSDSQGKKHELTQSSYGVFIREQDRTLRKNAFEQMHSKYMQHENTMCELLNGNVQAHIFNARAHNFQSCLEASLLPKNIDVEVYHSLISAVNANVDVLHHYIRLREEFLNIGPLHLYDMYVPLASHVDIKMSYEEAEEAVIESVAPLGTEYQNILKRGLIEERWVDRYENINKRSGAYSSGCYDSMPYILMNYKGLVRDVFTLAHEAGHSMHSYLSRKNQPYQYADYPIFLAEVASTFNEDLLMRYLLKKAQSKEEKIFLLNQQIEDIRATLFRQTMFAEFELFIHERAEKNIPLTPKMLKEQFFKLNVDYFGPATIDRLIEYEWARIPHFYYNFYVYQYATGISAALALSEKVSQGGKKERDAYLSFLKSGSSQYPIELLKKAGVDMRSAAPVESAIHKFQELVKELASLLGKKKSVAKKTTKNKS